MLTGFPGSSAGQESTCSAGDPGSIPGLGRSPGEGIGYPLQYSFLESPHEQRSLAGYRLWGHRELDTTEQVSAAQHVSLHSIVYQHKDGAADPPGWGVWGPGPRDPGRAGSWVPGESPGNPAGLMVGPGPQAQWTRTAWF